MSQGRLAEGENFPIHSLFLTSPQPPFFFLVSPANPHPPPQTHPPPRHPIPISPPVASFPGLWPSPRSHIHCTLSLTLNFKFCYCLATKSERESGRRDSSVTKSTSCSSRRVWFLARMLVGFTQTMYTCN